MALLILIPRRRPQYIDRHLSEHQYSGGQHDLAIQWDALGTLVRFTLNQAEPTILLPSTLMARANGPQLTVVENCGAAGHS